jgi:uncharacterized membrane protein
MSTTTMPAPAVVPIENRSWLPRHWFLVLAGIYGIWVWLPFVAPILMHIGWDVPGRGLYLIYSLFCHQLPERSFFLFGRSAMYSLAQIQAVWKESTDPMVLRQFIGNSSMGWKVAWSDRMVSWYTSVWLFAMLWHPIRNKVRPLPWWGFLLLLAPIVLDGGTHMISDFAGIGQGFRDSNLWLAALTNHALPAWFYAGDALGSFNSWMRLITGVLAGLAVVWFAFPYLEESFSERPGAAR